ncbi:MAG: type IV pilus modification PilV family protein, partial [Actinomycetota bacterium]
MSRLRHRSNESGFTLVEVMAALVVFAIITLGIVPLMVSSIRASSLSRSYTKGKNVGIQAMERVRGLPYFISYNTEQRKVDILDLYFPGTGGLAAGQSYTGATGNPGTEYVFTTTCDKDSTNPACPQGIPDGYTINFQAQFVRPDPNPDPTQTQSYTPIPPYAGYVWNSTGGLDVSASQLMKMVITTDWKLRGATKSFKLTTLLSDRKFSGTKVSGNAKIAYGVQVLTTFEESGEISELTATAGSAESNVGSRTVSTASQTVDAGSIELIQEPADPAGQATLVDSFTGAQAAFDAPPTQTPGAVSANAGTVQRLNFAGQPAVAGLSGTDIPSGSTVLKASVADELPTAIGGFTYKKAPGQEDLWVDSQADLSGSNPLRLDPSGHIVALRPRITGLEQGLGGSSSVITTPLGTYDRGVNAKATLTVNELRLLPTNFITSPSRSVFVIDTFSATVDCKSTGSAASAVPTATWTADIRYKVDPTNNGIIDATSYGTRTLSGSSASDFLAELKSSINPLVYDGAAASDDIYLFEDPATNKKGYLSNATSLFDAGTSGISEGPLGQTTAAEIGGAIRIDTAATNPSKPGTSRVSVAVGSLSCQAVDKR